MLDTPRATWTTSQQQEEMSALRLHKAAIVRCGHEMGTPKKEGMMINHNPLSKNKNDRPVGDGTDLT